MAPPPGSFLADIQKGKKLSKVDQKDVNDRTLPSPSQARMKDLQRQIASQRSLPTTASCFEGASDGICALVRFLREHPKLGSTPGLFVEACPQGDPTWVLHKVEEAVSLAMVHDILEDIDVLTLAQTIKLYLKQRAEPLIPESLNASLLRAMSPYISRDECVAQLQTVVQTMDETAVDILHEVCEMLGEVRGIKTSTLAYSFGPLLIRAQLNPSAITSVKQFNAAVEALVEERDLIFRLEKPVSTLGPESYSQLSSPSSIARGVGGPAFGADRIAEQLSKLRKTPCPHA